MNIRKGDMWTAWKDAALFCITTNSYIRRDGALVMGRGIALETKQRFPGVEFKLGAAIKHLSVYGLLVSTYWPSAKLGAFQVKLAYSDPADPAIIEYSTEKLCQWAKTHPVPIHLNFPGIGFGRLSYDQVFPIIERLPDNVTIWMR